MTGSSGVDIVDSFTNPMEGSRRADGQIRQRHVIVNGPNETNDSKVMVQCSLSCSDLSCRQYINEASLKRRISVH